MAIATAHNLAPLFQPFQFGSRALKNRIVMAPMTRSKSPHGVPGANVAEYYRRRAAGGVGLIITEGTVVNHPASAAYPDIPSFFGEAALAGWRQVAQAVHEAGGAIIPQLWHAGPSRRPGMPPDPAVPGYGPMEVTAEGQLAVKAMTQADIDAVTAAFAQAAADAKRTGFDGIELHGAHEYLIDAFLWAGTNQRTDGYGGSLENRSRLALEIVSAARNAVGPDFPIVFRFSQWKQRDYNARIAETPEELGQILKPLAGAGVDVFHASTRRFWEPEFEGNGANLAAWAKRLTGKPSITVGSVGLSRAFRDSETAEMENNLHLAAERVEAGDYDLVAVGRALIPDAEWPAKAREERFNEIIPFTTEALATLS